MSVLRGERKPGKKWTARDRVFALALTAYEADLCHGCGQPMSMTSGDHPHDYDIRTTRCMACAEIEEHRNNSKEPETGEKTYVVLDE
ncbi:hypothetical protein M3G00_07795 [Brevibacterium casei]|uniref:hypothetical protein n=1 Tax=Brevibacterium casei TaxID=33889 RepID=UPI00223B6CF1|nr:hypothetical protein [Brevibacterium casei]MCT1446214.1 hypothetical protein [Brevibacterium casei]MCT2182837.1 hypothetical protein [Brevibacterium casei]